MNSISYVKSISTAVIQICSKYEHQLSYGTTMIGVEGEITSMLSTFMKCYCNVIMDTMNPHKPMEQLERLKKTMPMVINIQEYNDTYNKTIKQLEVS